MKNLIWSLLAVLAVSTPAPAEEPWQRELADPLPARQVHLDFHTSELIEGIGERFDKAQWQAALKAGHVNHINVFGKGHHSWSYYPTEVGMRHPHLDFDLLGAQIEASHEIGVKAPIYFAVGWSATDAERHPEWVARNKDGSFMVANWDLGARLSDVRPHYSWKFLCPNPDSDYHRLILAQVEEICRRYEVDGFWFDIYHSISQGCYCHHCLARMKKEGVDLEDAYAVSVSTAKAAKVHMRELRELVARHHPRATVYFNPTPHVVRASAFTQRTFDLNTHQDLEDLPTTWGGYDKLPLESKYHLQQGTPVVAMSGKFHKAWGEFGGFKHPDAIKYEAATMIAFGAAANFGDQLHPSGEMDMATYRNIGQAFEYVKRIEDYGPGGAPVSNLGVWLSLDTAADHGLVRMLLELHYDFLLADAGNLEQLDVVLLPSQAELTEKDAEALSRFMGDGGAVIAFGRSVFADGGEALLDAGVRLVGDSSFDFDYTVLRSDELGREVVESPFLNYEAGVLLEVVDAQVLAAIREPYFNRTYAGYSSHRETPYRLEDSRHPAITRKGNLILFAHELDRLYYTHAVRLHRQVVQNAIDRVYDTAYLEVEGLPSAGRVSLLHQEKEGRYVAHLLYSPALQRGEVMVIEDFLPVPDARITVKVPQKVKKAYVIPGRTPVELKRQGDAVSIQVPTFTMHCGVVLEY